MQDKTAQRRWWVASIEIHRVAGSDHGDYFPAEFKIEGEMEVDFLFRGLKSRFFTTDN